MAWLFRAQTEPRSRRAALSLRLGVAMLLLGFAAMSGARTLDFRTSSSLWAVELAHNPDSRAAMAGAAVCRMREGRHAEALQHLRRLVKELPDRWNVRVNLAETLMKLGEPADALEHSGYLIRQQAKNPFYWLLHSRGLRDVGQFDESVAAALHCLEIAEPKGLVYRTAASARREQGDLDAAIKLLDASVSAGLDHRSVILDRALFLLEAGRTRLGLRDVGILLQRDPFDFAAITLRGQLIALRRQLAARPPR